jgi:Tol biopolymer transport system component
MRRPTMGKKAVIGALLTATGLMTAGVMIWTGGPRASEPLKAAGPNRGSEANDDEGGRFVDQLKRHPAQPSKGNERHGLYLMDVDQGMATLITDEPAPGLTHCGSARWSRDGKGLLFDATPGAEWNRTHLFAIDPGETRPKITDLGAGNCPSPSPDGKHIAFLLNSGAMPGVESGLWIMNSDGSGRRHLDAYGRPYWSPDNRQLLIVSFSDPCRLTLMDVETGKTQPVEVPGNQVYSVPSWVDKNTLVAVLGTGNDRAIALIDVTNPEQSKIKEVLREKDAKPSVTPAYPVFSVAAQRCIFVNANPKGMSLYSVQQGKTARAKRVERDGFDKIIADLAMSPDGRHLIFCSDRPGLKSP